MQVGSMPNTIIDELNSKIEKAISYKLIPNQRYTEIEFTVDTNGQASVIEFWHSANRLHLKGCVSARLSIVIIS